MRIIVVTIVFGEYSLKAARFVSDCLGHQPLIPDNSFTTKLPLDVDESQFNPSSTIIPHPSDSCQTDNAYFGLKCR